MAIFQRKLPLCRINKLSNLLLRELDFFINVFKYMVTYWICYCCKICLKIMFLMIIFHSLELVVYCFSMIK